MSLQQDLSEVFGHLLSQVKHLTDASCEVLHGLRRTAATQSLVIPIQSGNYNWYSFYINHLEFSNDNAISTVVKCTLNIVAKFIVYLLPLTIIYSF